VPPGVEEMYGNNKARDHLAIVELIIQHSKEVFVVFDGLDECTGDQQIEIINLIRQFCNAVFLTSQPQISHLVKNLQPCHLLEIEANDDDVRNFIDQRLDLEKSIKPELKDDLRTNLMVGAEGMYSSPFHYC
jgi:hypothetical protein